MNKTSVSTSVAQPTLKGLMVRALAWRWALPAVLLAMILAFGFYTTLGKETASGQGPMPVNPLIEDKLGIRVTQVAVSADNGLIDFRYQVLDPSKAEQIMSAADKHPTLISEDNGFTIKNFLYMPHHERIVAGRTYYLLFYNTDDAIKQGGYVTVSLGDLQLEHVPVR